MRSHNLSVHDDDFFDNLLNIVRRLDWGRMSEHTSCIVGRTPFFSLRHTAEKIATINVMKDVIFGLYIYPTNVILILCAFNLHVYLLWYISSLNSIVRRKKH